jgi:hypothetical protein
MSGLEQYSVAWRIKELLKVPNHPSLLAFPPTHIARHAAGRGCFVPNIVAATEHDVGVHVVKNLQGFGGSTQGDQTDCKVPLSRNGAVSKVELLQAARLLPLEERIALRTPEDARHPKEGARLEIDVLPALPLRIVSPHHVPPGQDSPSYHTSHSDDRREYAQQDHSDQDHDESPIPEGWPPGRPRIQPVIPALDEGVDTGAQLVGPAYGAMLIPAVGNQVKLRLGRSASPTRPRAPARIVVSEGDARVPSSVARVVTHTLSRL